MLKLPAPNSPTSHVRSLASPSLMDLDWTGLDWSPFRVESSTSSAPRIVSRSSPVFLIPASRNSRLPSSNIWLYLGSLLPCLRHSLGKAARLEQATWCDVIKVLAPLPCRHLAIHLDCSIPRLVCFLDRRHLSQSARAPLTSLGQTICKAPRVAAWKFVLEDGQMPKLSQGSL
ncbi:hypothetical protein BKA80DRAFT_18325 [Phyllosticta citrichinensis]